MIAATMDDVKAPRKSFSSARIIQIGIGFLVIFGFAITPQILANPEVLTDLIPQ